MILEIIDLCKENLVEAIIALIGILSLIVMFIPKDSWFHKSLGIFGQLFGFLGNLFRK